MVWSNELHGGKGRFTEWSLGQEETEPQKYHAKVSSSCPVATYHSVQKIIHNSSGKPSFAVLCCDLNASQLRICIFLRTMNGVLGPADIPRPHQLRCRRRALPPLFLFASVNGRRTRLKRQMHETGERTTICLFEDTACELEPTPDSVQDKIDKDHPRGRSVRDWHTAINGQTSDMCARLCVHESVCMVVCSFSS